MSKRHPRYLFVSILNSNELVLHAGLPCSWVFIIYPSAIVPPRWQPALVTLAALCSPVLWKCKTQARGRNVLICISLPAVLSAQAPYSFPPQAQKPEPQGIRSLPPFQDLPNQSTVTEQHWGCLGVNSGERSTPLPSQPRCPNPRPGRARTWRDGSRWGRGRH